MYSTNTTCPIRLYHSLWQVQIRPVLYVSTILFDKYKCDLSYTSVPFLWQVQWNTTCPTRLYHSLWQVQMRPFLYVSTILFDNYKCDLSYTYVSTILFDKVGNRPSVHQKVGSTSTQRAPALNSAWARQTARAARPPSASSPSQCRWRPGRRRRRRRCRASSPRRAPGSEAGTLGRRPQRWGSSARWWRGGTRWACAGRCPSPPRWPGWGGSCS